ncbi:MAG: phosphoribosylformylglycinamidine cyclo-ligase, partial [Lentisphaerae bacterium]
EFDLVGCITGVVERDRIISGETISAGDVGIGLASNGLHTNGYSLARKVLLEEAGLDLGTQYPELEGATLAEALLRPHVCYWPVIRTLLDMDDVVIKGMAHITGGGFYDNIPRILPDNVDVICHPEAFSKPPIFEMISKLGNVSRSEMYRVFNMGIGMIVFVEPSMARKVCDVAYQAGIPAMVMADVVAGNRKVRIAGIDD